jgi:hypothetical protein
LSELLGKLAEDIAEPAALRRLRPSWRLRLTLSAAHQDVEQILGIEHVGSSKRPVSECGSVVLLSSLCKLSMTYSAA